MHIEEVRKYDVGLLIGIRYHGYDMENLHSSMNESTNSRKEPKTSLVVSLSGHLSG